ncbi:MAG: 1-deoxy-D-xylulose-5-phosphate synthase [Planctomycetes bacterium]|nr:1-deoxy-D-xylulose-5-phosphate synthase [Planctomycetota bacterium]
MTDILSKVNHPRDLKPLSLEELEQLGEEIRERVLEVVDRNGGHLASNLGSVELTLALHKVFDVPNDRLVWDTSHQTYPHKLVTGRKDRFEFIRTYGGICGFTNHRESIFDLFDAGHAGTACSLALGTGTADSLQGKGECKTIAVVGDSAAAAGMTFEALNHGGVNRQNMLVILNDNNMSINKAVGALSTYLTKVRTKPAYQDIKRELRTTLAKIPVVGKHIEEVLGEVHDRFRDNLLPGTLFRELGYRYYGPLDGHDLGGLIKTFEDLKSIHEPVLLHLDTKKGQGFEAAEADPIKYHALKNFLPKKSAKKETESNGSSAAGKRPGYSGVFKEAIVKIGRKDRRVCTITAGMPDGTGLLKFAEEFPDRYFDVGICEQHGAGFGSGLAFGGMRPVYAVYSTFCQRAYDQIIHDVCIQENSVIFCLDRAGLTGEDGWTHHGVYDIAFMRCVPGIVLMAPRDAGEFENMLQLAIDQTTTPVAIRYPKATVPEFPASAEQELRIGKAEVLVEGEEVALFAYGSMVENAWEALEELSANGVKATLVNARFAKPLDIELLRNLSKNHHTLVTLEEHVLMGGFGSAVTEAIADANLAFNRILRFGVPDEFITFGPRARLLEDCGLAPASIVRRILDECAETRTPEPGVRGHRVLS